MLRRTEDTVTRDAPPGTTEADSQNGHGETEPAGQSVPATPTLADILPVSERGAPACISVVLRARNDLDQAARALGFGAAILITLVAVAILLPGASQSTAATVIAFTSTVATSFLVRPQDHEIEGQLLRAPRLRLALIGSMPVIGSVVLAVGLHRLRTLLILLALGWIVLRLTVTITPRRELVPLNSTSAGYVEQINDLRQVSWRIVDSAEGRRLPVGRLVLANGHEVDARSDEPASAGIAPDAITDDALVAVARDFADRAGGLLVAGAPPRGLPDDAASSKPVD